MTDVQKELLRLLSKVLFQNNPIEAATDEILREAKTQAVSTLISPDYSALAANIRVVHAHAELTELLKDIPFTTFKGYASAYYYPIPTRRVMGDVDFIVGTSYFQRTTDLLVANGWKEGKEKHSRHTSFFKGNINFELHHEIKGIPNGVDGIAKSNASSEGITRNQLADLIETSRPVETQQGAVIIPDDFHHGLIMLLHIASHMINDGGIGLRHLCDWAVYVNCVDLEKYRPQLESVGLWIYACQLTAVCTAYLGLPEEKWTGEWPEEFLQELIDEFLSAGNFGRKEAGRIALSMMRKTSFASMTRKHYPAAENPLLLPLFMMVYIIRYAFLVLKGKRRIINPSTIFGERKRSDLYEQFRLFEI